MKLKTLLLASMAAAVLSLSSCTGLGFGVDVDSGGVSPYFYGNNYYGPLGVGASWRPGYLGGPLWSTPPSAPPVLGYGPGSIGMPQPPSYRPQPTRPPQRPQGQPQQPNRPQGQPQQPNRPSVGQQTRPIQVGPDLKPINRPGNFGLPD